MLAIEVEYLMGRSYAADFRDEAKSEWPPNPDRLFEALVSAHHDTFSEGGESFALQWLEKQGAPQIEAGDIGRAVSVVNFVPTNYNGKSGSPHPDQRGKQPRVFPAQSPSSPVVRFVWPDAEPGGEIREALERLLARVPSLGRACSLVRMKLGDGSASPTYVPDLKGEEVLRVFGEGRLEELEILYSLGRRPSLGPQMRYSRNQAKPSVPDSCFGEMIVLRRVGGRGLSIEAALTLTSALRKALIKLSGHDAGLCGLLSGHDAEIHCAFAALPFVGHEHSDGRLMGAAVILPRGIAMVARRKVLRVCASIEKINLKEEAAFWEVELCGFDVPQRALTPMTWSGACGYLGVGDTYTFGPLSQTAFTR